MNTQGQNETDRNATLRIGIKEGKHMIYIILFFLEDMTLLNRIVWRKFTPAQRITRKPTMSGDERMLRIYNGSLKKRKIFDWHPEKIEILSYIRDGKYS